MHFFEKSKNMVFAFFCVQQEAEGKSMEKKSLQLGKIVFLLFRNWVAFMLSVWP
jgi:hypothetical protein